MNHPAKTDSLSRGAIPVWDEEARPRLNSLADLMLRLHRQCHDHHGGGLTCSNLVSVLGHRSFGPVILIVGLIALAPIREAPAMLALTGAIALLTGGQMLMARRAIWLPPFVGRRAMDSNRCDLVLSRYFPYARRADRWLGTKLNALTSRPFFMAMGLCCMLLAAAMPFLIRMPWVSVLPGLAFVAFGVSLLTRDGVAAAIGFAASIAALALFFSVIKLPLLLHALAPGG